MPLSQPNKRRHDDEDQQHHNNECKIENGKLYFDRHCYQLNQTVCYEKDGSKTNATIVNISEREITLRKSSDGSKLKVLPSQLNKGRCSIKKRLAI